MPRRTNQQQPRRRAEGRGAGGTPADRLIRAWLDEDFDSFESLAEACIAESREGVLAAAVRKLAERHEEEAVEEFALALTEMAEAAEGQAGFDFAELVLLPAVVAGPVPDPAPLAASLAGSGAFPPEAGLVFAEGWRSAETLHALSPVAVRRVLLAVAAGQAPAELPPLSPGGVVEGGVLVLVGAITFRAGSPGADEEEDPEADPEGLAASDQARAGEMADAFERWRASLDPEATGGALILPFCPPSDLAAEIMAVLQGIEAEDPALDEVADFVEAAQAEAGGEEVVARLEPREGGVEVVVLTRSGRMLDRRVFGLEAGGASVADLRRVVEACVPVLEDGA